MMHSFKSLVLGDLPAFSADPLTFLEERTLGETAPVRLRFGNRPVYILSQPSAVRHVLVDHHERYIKSSFQKRLQPLFGEGMLTASGARWEASRKAVRGQFSGRNIDEGMQFAINTMLQEVAGLAARGGAPVSLPPLSGRLTLRMASAAMFRQVFDQSAADEIYHLASQAHHWVSETMWKPIHLGVSLPTPGNRRFRILLAAMERIVTEMRREPKGVLAGLAELAGPYGDRAVRDEFVTMVLAGFETSGTVAAWLIYALASRPDIVDWLREEVDAVLADGGDLTPGDLRGMPRVRAVVDEVLRLYPSIWWFAREATADDVIDGVAVPKGGTVFVCPWVLHRQPNLWRDPEVFDPTRFMGAEAIDRHAYIPFGAGPRVCIGQHLARAEMMAIAASLVAGFDLAPLSGTMERLRPVGGVTLAPPPEGMEVSFIARGLAQARQAA